MISFREALICGRRFFMFAAVIAAFVVVIILATKAQARWKPEYANADPAIRAWFSAQHNAAGQWCCDKSDGQRFDGAYTFDKDGSVTLNLGAGQKRTLPAYMVLKGPNPTGSAVWWHLGQTDFCFAPGPMT